MNKRWQYSVTIGASLLVIGLYFLPRVVIDNDSESAALEVSTETPEVEQQGETTVVDTHDHDHQLSPEQENTLVEARAQFLSAQSEVEQKEALTKLTSIWKDSQHWDSVAVYAERIATRYPSLENDRIAGEAYYEAMSLTPDQQLASRFGAKSRAYLKDFLESNPDDLTIKVKLGMTYVPTQNPMQGVLMLREVIEADPKNELALLNLGLLSMRSGQFEKAIERFTNLTEIQPENGKAQFYLGVAYLEAQVPERARPAFEQAMKFSAGDSLLRQAAQNYLENLP